ncbi:MAG: site-2 protease family protein [Anaerolineales bacterium]|nr:site-2 protease family protein [Anaerolineales bacterium]
MNQEQLAPSSSPIEINEIIKQVFCIEDITMGRVEEGYQIRYRGKLTEDSITAFEKLDKALSPLGLIPLFRKENDHHAILITNRESQKSEGFPYLNMVLFGFTLFSMVITGVLYSYQGEVPETPGQFVKILLAQSASGFPFALSMMAILLLHEMGHYTMARIHKTNVSLPFFIPFPMSFIGTLGAFINLKSPPKNKRALLDIGIAGPMAGLIVTIPILIYGLFLSPIESLPSIVPTDTTFTLEGNSILYLELKYLIKGALLPEPAVYGNIPKFAHWVIYYYTGFPLPMGGRDVMLHPIAWSGWAGLLVTSLNLIPVGQLDGGHILYSLLGDRSLKFLYPILVFLGILGFFWQGWWLWVLLLLFIGRSHTEPLDQITELDPIRKGVAWLGVILMVLLFIPVPLIAI